MSQCVSVAIFAQALTRALMPLQDVQHESWRCRRCWTPNWRRRSQCYRCHDLAPGAVSPWPPTWEHENQCAPEAPAVVKSALKSGESEVAGAEFQITPWSPERRQASRVLTMKTAESATGSSASASNPLIRYPTSTWASSVYPGLRACAPQPSPLVLYGPQVHDYGPAVVKSACETSRQRAPMQSSAQPQGSQAAQPQAAQPQGMGFVSKIISQTSWYVDRLELHLRTEEVHVHGGEAWESLSENEMTLNSDEYICAVTQQNFQVGYLGSALIFHLSSGRVISILGSASNKKAKSVIELVAPSAKQIIDLKFEGSRLAGVITAPVSFEFFEC